MTDTQPSPAAMEAANACFGRLHVDSLDSDNVEEIARALDAFARDAVRAAVVGCCEVVCGGCMAKSRIEKYGSNGWRHDFGTMGGPTYQCAAEPIRLAFADVLEGRS